MKTIQDNIAKVNELRDKIKNHCMCLHLKEDDNKITIIFPLGFSVDGTQVRYKYHGYSKSYAFELLLNKMEDFWKKSLLIR